MGARTATEVPAVANRRGEPQRGSDAKIGPPFKNEIHEILAVRLTLLHGEWTLAVNRIPPAPAFADDDVARLQAVVAPLEQALRLRERLERREAEPSGAVLDQISTGVINIAPDGQVRSTNLQARRWLQRSAGLSVRRGRLHLDDPEAADRLQVSLETARRGERADAVLLAHRREAPSYLALAAGDGGPDNGLLVFLYAMDDNAAHDRLLQRLFGLTSSEAELARLLIAGPTPQEAADRRGVRITTVRSQITSILTKTGARRMTEAVALLCTLASSAPLD